MTFPPVHGVVVVMAKKTKCEKCEFVWTPKVKEPRACPRCKSYFWQVPRKKKRVAA